MAFIGTTGLRARLNKDIISFFDPTRIKNGAYELSLGAEVFQTDSSPRCVRELKDGEKIEIKPGQFALLLTKEYVKIPEDVIAFISIKAGIKFKGLVNVSGFHVDPGFEGNLLFSVYNAGPSIIILSNGTAYFPMWFAQLNESQNYEGSHDKQTRIPDDPVAALSQGELASPNSLSKRIDEVKYLKTKIEWVALAVLGVVTGLAIKFYSDSSKLKDAIEYGYQKKSVEIMSDSVSRDIRSKNSSGSKLNVKIDSLIDLQSRLTFKLDSLIDVNRKAKKKSE